MNGCLGVQEVVQILPHLMGFAVCTTVNGTRVAICRGVYMRRLYAAPLSLHNTRAIAPSDAPAILKPEASLLQAAARTLGFSAVWMPDFMYYVDAAAIYCGRLSSHPHDDAMDSGSDAQSQQVASNCESPADRQRDEVSGEWQASESEARAQQQQSSVGAPSTTTPQASSANSAQVADDAGVSGSALSGHDTWDRQMSSETTARTQMQQDGSQDISTSALHVSNTHADDGTDVSDGGGADVWEGAEPAPEDLAPELDAQARLRLQRDMRLALQPFLRTQR